MNTVRIVCKAPPSVAGARYTTLPSSIDAHVYLRKDDGTEIEIPGVTRILWRVAVDGEPARAMLEIDGVALDVDALLELAK